MLIPALEPHQTGQTAFPRFPEALSALKGFQHNSQHCNQSSEINHLSDLTNSPYAYRHRRPTKAGYPVDRMPGMEEEEGEEEEEEKVVEVSTAPAPVPGGTHLRLFSDKVDYRTHLLTVAMVNSIWWSRPTHQFPQYVFHVYGGRVNAHGFVQGMDYTLVQFTYLREAFCSLLRHFHLIHDITVPLNMTCEELLLTVAQLLENSPMQYIMETPAGLQKLSFLGMVNSGRIRPSDNNQIRLARVSTPLATMEDLLYRGGRRFYSRSLIENGRFVIHLSM